MDYDDDSTLIRRMMTMMVRINNDDYPQTIPKLDRKRETDQSLWSKLTRASTQTRTCYGLDPAQHSSPLRRLRRASNKRERRQLQRVNHK